MNKQGSTKSKKCNELTRKIWDFAIERNIWLTANFCPGVENIEADAASRIFNDQTEWTLYDEGFQTICDRFGNPSIDLFASRLNNKVDRYCSWEPDPGAMYVDALMLDWSGEKFYAFPPFAIVHLVLQKIINDQAEGIVVVPFWESQPWFTLFRKLLITEPLIIPVDTHELFLPFDRKQRRMRHPLARKLRLMVGICSASRMNRQDLNQM